MTTELEVLDSADTELANLARALGHPHRVAIVKYLASCDKCLCGAIVDLLPVAQSTVSQHLKKLKEAGWIQGEIDGQRVCYCVNPKALARFKSLIDDIKIVKCDC